jgi:hypothetical protein
MASVPTRDDLAALLRAKDAAQVVMSAAYKACEQAKGDTLDARLSLDMDRQRALAAYCAADNSYDAAMKLFLANNRVAA